MALTNLTGTTWTLKDKLYTYPGGSSATIKEYNINFTTSENIPSDGQVEEANSFNKIQIGYHRGVEWNRIACYLSENDHPYFMAQGNDTKILPDSWKQSSYFTGKFTITGGTDATNSELITWLQANANQIIPSITILYKGLKIAALEDSGTKTLLTEGKYCESNIVINYNKSAAFANGDEVSY